MKKIGVVPKEIAKVAELTFLYPNNGKTAGWDQICHVYICYSWVGNPIESEEMRPKWFSKTELPFDQMWPDDPLWLPNVLRGQKIVATFHINEKFSLVTHKVEIVDKF